MLGVSGWSGLAEASGEPFGNANALSVNHGAGIAPTLKRRRVVDEVHANLFENLFGIRFDDLERFSIQDFEVRDIALNKTRCFETNSGSLGTAGCASAPSRPAPRRCVCHGQTPYFLTTSCRSITPAGAADRAGLRRMRGKSDTGAPGLKRQSN
jgi:hypothetical protein